MTAIRALGALRAPDTRVLHDPYASAFLGRWLRIMLGLSQSTAVAGALVRACDVAIPGLIGYVVCRHRQADD